MPHWRPEMGLSTRNLSWAPDEQLGHALEALTKTPPERQVLCGTQDAAIMHMVC